MPNSPDYVWEKMYVAIDCMCGRGSVSDRIVNATISALMRLNDDDLPEGELRDDLKYVLKWTRRNVLNERVLELPDELEHGKLISKMLHIMLETHTKD